MRDGKYTVDSIGDGTVKLLCREDESIEELLPADSFPFEIHEGLILQVTSKEKAVIIEPLFKETRQRRNQMEQLMERLKNRK